MQQCYILYQTYNKNVFACDPGTFLKGWGKACYTEYIKLWKRVLMLNLKSKYVNENLFMTEDSLILVVVSLRKFE